MTPIDDYTNPRRVLLLGLGALAILAGFAFGMDRKRPTVDAIGDSITEGHILGRDHGDGGYPQFLTAVVPPTVRNDGHCGWTLAQLATLHYAPADAYLVEAGTNDLIKGASPSETLVRLKTLLNRIHGRVILGSLTPVSAHNYSNLDPQVVNRYNALLRAFAAHGGLALVDQSETQIGPDGIHPTEDGYRQMAERFSTALFGVAE